MKIFQSSIFRALCSIAVGMLLIKYPDDTLTWMTIAIGVLFFLSGIIALIAYWNARRHAGEYTITDQQGRIVSGGQPAFPIVGAGSLILGLILALSPTVLVGAMMYILGAILILGAIGQLIVLVNARRLGRVHFGFWIAPSIILLTGLFVVLKPQESSQLPLLILGWCSMLYGITEMINALKIHNLRRQWEKEQKKPGKPASIDYQPQDSSQRSDKSNRESNSDNINRESDSDREQSPAPSATGSDSAQQSAPATRSDDVDSQPKSSANTIRF